MRRGEKLILALVALAGPLLLAGAYLVLGPEDVDGDPPIPISVKDPPERSFDEVLAPGGLHPCDLARYLSQYDLMARVYPSPSRDAVRRLVASQVPVIVGHRLSLGRDIGHYRVIRGYDDVSREFIVHDPLRSFGPDYRLPYGIFIELSKEGGAMIPIFPPEADPLVRSLMRSMGRAETLYSCP